LLPLQKNREETFDYARNSYSNEFTDFPPRYYSCAPPHTSSHAVSHFFPAPNHRLYGFGSQENSFAPRRFGYDPCLHRGDRFLHRHSFSVGGFYTHFEPEYLDSPRFSHRGSCPIGSKGEVQKTVKTSSGRMVKC
jgi:hypothetical protein